MTFVIKLLENVVKNMFFNSMFNCTLRLGGGPPTVVEIENRNLT